MWSFFPYSHFNLSKKTKHTVVQCITRPCWINLLIEKKRDGIIRMVKLDIETSDGLMILFLSCMFQFVMKKLYIGGDPLLQSVNMWDPEVTELRESIRSALIQATIPLRAYAAEYEKHLELHNSDTETFLK